MALAPRDFRRRAALAAPWAVIALAAAAVVSGWLDLSRFGLLQALLLLLLLATLVAVGFRTFRAGARGRGHSRREQAEIGALLVVSAFALAAPGGLDGPLFPVVYLVMAVVVAFLSAPVGIALTAFALALDLGSFAVAGALALQPATALAHAAFLSLFAVLYRILLAGQVAGWRARQSLALRERQREVESRAREYRLVGGAPASDDGKWMTAAVRAVGDAVGNALEMAVFALKPHTVAVYLLQDGDRVLRLQDSRTRSAQPIVRDLDAREGIPGAVLKRAGAMRLHGGPKGVTWYGRPGAVGAVVVVPLFDHGLAGGPDRGTIRGLLLADRLAPEPFADEDEEFLAAAGREVMRAMEIERLMDSIRTARDEKEALFQSIEELNRVSKPDEVFASVLEAAGRAVPALDFRAVTTCQEHEDGTWLHRVERVAGEADPRLEGREFGDNQGLVATVARYGVLLPMRDGRQPVFAEGFGPRGLGTLWVVPLGAGGRILGTLVCGAVRRNAFGKDAEGTLGVIAGQGAQALLRARLFEQTERMATTDGLTGLVNHRHFQVRFDEELARATRSDRPLALVLVDIDHFKAVNDTYGHATGDLVLKGVARILQGCARSTDLVARYGGEEFALLLPDTDMAGGKQIAERIRVLVEEHRFETEQGSLHCTLSLGIASWPAAATSKAGLFEAADGCLYHCKRTGRNRSATVEEVAREREAGEPPGDTQAAS